MLKLNHWIEEEHVVVPGLREALLLRIPEKTSHLLIKRVEPLLVLALSKHDSISLHHPPPCDQKIGH